MELIAQRAFIHLGWIEGFIAKPLVVVRFDGVPDPLELLCADLNLLQGQVPGHRKEYALNATDDWSGNPLSQHIGHLSNSVTTGAKRRMSRLPRPLSAFIRG